MAAKFLVGLKWTLVIILGISLFPVPFVSDFLWSIYPAPTWVQFFGLGIVFLDELNRQRQGWIWAFLLMLIYYNPIYNPVYFIYELAPNFNFGPFFPLITIIAMSLLVKNITLPLKREASDPRAPKKAKAAKSFGRKAI